MDKPVAFVHPDTQCPKKPKGRKPKVPKAEPVPMAASSRPSAAACGFSTHKMTDEEVFQRIASHAHGDSAKGSRDNGKKSGLEDANEMPEPRKKKKVVRKRKSQSQVTGGSVEDGQGAGSSTLPVGDVPSEDSGPTKKSRTCKSAKPSASTGSTARKGKGKRGATETDLADTPTPKAKSAKSKKSRTAGAAPPPPSRKP